MAINTEIHSWTMWRVTDLGMLIRKWDVYITPRSSRLRNLWEREVRKKSKSQRWEMPVRRQCFSDTTGQMHIGTHGD